MITQQEKNEYQRMKHEQLESCFERACDNQNPELICYFLSDKELNCLVNVDHEDNLALHTACLMKDKDLVSFLLTSTDLVFTADIVPLFKFHYFGRDFETINFLINDCLINKDYNLELNNFVNSHSELLPLFNRLDLDIKLDKKDELNMKKNKI